MKFLLAGLGSVGRRHLRNLVSLGETDIVLLRTHRATLSDHELSGFPVETDIFQALARHKPDAVVVANPTALHLDIAIPAAAAGCHILLEKPVSNSLDRLDLLQQTAQKSGSRILVGFQFRYHPTLNKAREIIQAGTLGKILAAHAWWGEYLPNWHPWEDYRNSYAARADLGGGVTATLTHPLDYLRFLVGEVRSLCAFNGHISPLELDVDDAAEVALKFKSGALGGLHVNYFQRPPIHRFEIVGTAGTLRWDNADGCLSLYQMPAEFGAWSAEPLPAVEQQFKLPPDFERNHLFLAQTRHFIEVVRSHVQPACTLEDGIRAQQLVCAIHESNDTGKFVNL